MRRAFITSIVVCSTSCASSGVAPHRVATPAPITVEDAAQNFQKSTSPARAHAMVASLASQVGARLTGGPKDRAAIDWALAAMRSVGLSSVHEERVEVPHWERGAEAAEIVGPEAKALAILALGGSVGTPPSGLEGDVVELSSLAELDKLDDAAVTGKIVFFDVKTRRARDGGGYGESVGVRFQGPRRAGEKGAIAALVRSIGTDTDAPHTGATTRKAKIPAAALSNASADALHATLMANKRARVKLTLGATWHPDADSANVVGEIPGTTRKDEIVLLGAHLDSWDVGQGAIDDGAGCAIVLEAARLLSGIGQPKRTVRVVLFAAEEIALSGGEAYAKAHEAEAARHIVTMEADMGTAKVYAARYFGAPDARGEFERIAHLVAPLGVAIEPKDAFGGADMKALRALGVPSFELAQDFSAYFDVHHTANDTIERVDPEGLAQSAAAYATVAWAVSEMPRDFGRVPEEKRGEK